METTTETTKTRPDARAALLAAWDNEINTVKHFSRQPETGTKRINLETFEESLREYNLDSYYQEMIADAAATIDDRLITKDGKWIKRLTRAAGKDLPNRVSIGRELLPEIKTMVKAIYDGIHNADPADLASLPDTHQQVNDMLDKLTLLLSTIQEWKWYHVESVLNAPQTMKEEVYIDYIAQVIAESTNWMEAVNLFYEQFEKISDVHPNQIVYRAVVDTAGLLGDILQKSITDESFSYDYKLSLTDSLFWDNDASEEQNFGHSGSCWFNEYADSTPTFFRSGHGLGLLWNHRTNDPDSGYARLWIAPISLETENDALFTFNQYSNHDEESILKSSKMIADILSQQTGIGWTVTLGTLSVNNKTTIPYINHFHGGNGYIIHPTPADPANRIPRGHSIDVNWKRLHADEDDFPGNNPGYYCESCEDRIDEDDVYHDPDGRILCESCFEENYIHCERCGETISIEDSRSCENADGLYCEFCFDRLYTYCENCEDYYLDSDTRQVTIDGETTTLCDDCYEKLEIIECSQCHDEIPLAESYTIQEPPASDPQTGILLDTWHPMQQYSDYKDPTPHYCESCYNRLTDALDIHYHNPAQLVLFFIPFYNPTVVLGYPNSPAELSY